MWWGRTAGGGGSPRLYLLNFSTADFCWLFFVFVGVRAKIFATTMSIDKSISWHSSSCYAGDKFCVESGLKL
jgi:hypothetical protein